MFEYFPDNYIWNLGVVATLNSGGTIDEVDRACRPIRDAAARGDTGTADFMRAWQRIADQLEEQARDGRGRRAPAHRRAAVPARRGVHLPSRTDAERFLPGASRDLPALPGAD